MLLLAFCIAALFVEHSPAKSPKMSLFAEGGVTHFDPGLRMQNSAGFSGGALLNLSENFAVGVGYQQNRVDRPFEVIGGEQRLLLTVSHLMLMGNMHITSPGNWFELAFRGGFGVLNFHEAGTKFLFTFHRRSGFYVLPAIEGFWDKKMKYNLIVRGGVNVALFL